MYNQLPEIYSCNHWTNPTDINYGITRSETQLNTNASVPETFSYTPASDTVVRVGSQTVLED
ncbi:hypothetical protein EQO05_01650 [Methanosarcina sp. MSH10X1]|uniref:hypothetical protein n=1 Tax=Methanosarcina sp. MSH10X1 TaxID=2507075 RepID=UPI000FFB2A03|nr:hypothetical protein [Methanosarcina sp. MSH10X1]RXA21949.1 hypothetical protein EQO05_01650 [Methanosarcina sp. MSH10X1]